MTNFSTEGTNRRGGDANVTLSAPLVRDKILIRLLRSPTGSAIQAVDSPHGQNTRESGHHGDLGSGKEQKLPSAAPAIPSKTADKKPDANMIEAKEAAIVATESAAADAARKEQP